MARTPLFSTLRSLILTAATERDTLIPSRRDFIKGGLSLLAASATTSLISSCTARRFDSSNAPRVVILGGGLSGLCAAYKLQKGGIRPTIIEASYRLGGRVFSGRGFFPDNQTVELGGELIDSDHHAIRTLAEELGLTLDDVKVDESTLKKIEIFDVDGEILTEHAILEEFRPLAQEMIRVGKLVLGDRASFERYDRFSISEWLHQQPLSSKIRKLIEVAYTTEYGLEAEEQSLLNLLDLIGLENLDTFRIYGDSDERYHIRGGNESIIQALVPHLKEVTIESDARCEAIRGDEKGPFTVSIVRGEQRFELAADYVIATIPFSILRNIELPKTLPEKKVRIIKEIGYGTNAKIIAGFSSRIWKTKYQTSGAIFSASPLQNTWETSRGQSGEHGILTNFLGGKRGMSSGVGAVGEAFSPTLKELERILPGSREAHLPAYTLRMHWPTYKYSLGSYTCYKPGQASFAGSEGERFGHLLFAGEHASKENQGFMEGAVESGFKAAETVLAEA